ncbi:hypothetical protein [Collimonas silvisoli]|uniref:hypothetical protein n=1 Tax=Collimonas silvisoli TaxID=2825884 RepID=UPI001B8D697A|nr:hypothetical protein [Collimonas silvisoli]
MGAQRAAAEGHADHHVEPAAVGNDPGDAGIDRITGGSVKLNGAQIDAVFGSITRNFGDICFMMFSFC